MRARRPSRTRATTLRPPLTEPEGPFRADLRRYLASSTTTRTKVDLNLTCYAFTPPTAVIDVTVSCSLTPAYLAAATTSASAIFATRDAEKKARHLAGSLAQGRAYFTLCLSTLGGIGPSAVTSFIDHIFLRSLARERAAGLSPSAALRRRDHCYAAIHAALAASSAALLAYRTTTPAR